MLELKEKQEGKEILEEDVDVLKAMAHLVRLQIVNELMYHKTSYSTQLIEILELPQSTVS